MNRNTAYSKKYREMNPEKARAHWMVQEALRQKKLFREPCEICGGLKVHAHHDDYSKPLSVRWLCQKCHSRVHFPNGPKPDSAYYRKRKYVYRDRRKPRELWKRHPNVKKPELFDSAVIMRASGATYLNIAKALGVSRGTVYKWLNDVSYG